MFCDNWIIVGIVENMKVFGYEMFGCDNGF